MMIIYDGSSVFASSQWLHFVLILCSELIISGTDVSGSV